MASPFHSTLAFRAAFLEGLRSVLRRDPHHNIGVLVLVVANTVHDTELRSQLEPELHGIFDKLLAEPCSLLAVAPRTAGDDLRVFRQMATGGIGNLPSTEMVNRGPWRVQFNQTRALRPKRAAAQAFTRLDVPFDGRTFNFNRPYLAQECFWEERAADEPTVSLFYNKFPFAKMHALLVPARTKGQPQFLTKSVHNWTWNLVQQTSIAGFGAGYNSMGASASVNHQHFHSFVEPEGFPVTDTVWRHNGGRLVYPFPCDVLGSADDAWRWIARRHARNQPYNLVYTKAAVYCFSRRPQLAYETTDWASGFAWYELAGCVIVHTRKDLDSVTAADIERELTKLAP